MGCAISSAPNGDSMYIVHEILNDKQTMEPKIQAKT